MIKQTLEEWMAEGEQLFGKDIMNWKFKCPACGRVSSVRDFKDAGSKDPNDSYSNCIGRINGKGTSDGKDEGHGCNWAAYGLFGTLGKGRIVINEGKESEVFDFAVENQEDGVSE